MVQKEDPSSAPEAEAATVAGNATIPVAADGGIYKHLSPQARGELSKRLNEAAAMVLKEAESLESAHRAAGAEPDIGRWHIERSWWSMMLRYSSERHPRLIKVLPLLSSVCVFLMGFASTHLKDWWGIPVFVIATMLAAVCIGSIYVFAGKP
jgi:hypothetical protein